MEILVAIIPFTAVVALAVGAAYGTIRLVRRPADGRVHTGEQA